MDQAKQGKKTTNKAEKGLLRWVIDQLCQKYFDGSRQEMASALGVRTKDIDRVMESDEARTGVIVFENAMKYCIVHEISMDEMLSQYPGTQLQKR